MKGKFIVYSSIPRDFHASYYYRLLVPVSTMQALGHPVVPIFDDMNIGIPLEKRITAMCECDLNLFYQTMGDGLLQNVKTINAFKPVELEKDDWQYPPNWIVDTDDNLFNVNPLNGAFMNLGYRNPETGKPLEKRDKISWQDEVTGEKRVLWEDGINIDIEKNQKILGQYRAICQEVDAVTCSTPYVEELMKLEVGPKRTFVAPNAIRFDHFEKIDLRPHPEEVRILWQGSPTHYEDLYPIRHAIRRILLKNPHVVFVVWGSLYQMLIQQLPPMQLRQYKWVPFQQYHLRLATMGHDINLAPLKDTEFNRCRSCIKFYESAALPTPVPTLAQRTGSYADELIDGETGMLFSDEFEFETKLQAMIDSAKLRQTLGQNAKDWLSTHRDAFKVAKNLWEFWQELREMKRASTPLPSKAEQAVMKRRITRFNNRAKAGDQKALDDLKKLAVGVA